jgi:hypothetical protein
MTPVKASWEFREFCPAYELEDRRVEVSGKRRQTRLPKIGLPGIFILLVSYPVRLDVVNHRV